ncbi:hypothetical protein BFJ72_g13948 [Fusarium proliferatum]|uniref:RING-type domain-containing protein n=1 Tax=Gibberella intermedia TaxID=948311 RepID=A0A420S962_GIBIN|nr:hypothetical protein BFJ72_g13948 [Fusarium proliferatum]
MLRLRQFCNHGMDMLPPEVRDLLRTSADFKAYEESLSNRATYCAACRKTLDQNSEDQSLVLRDCGHVMCPRCEGKVKEDTPGPDGECIACVAHDTPPSMRFEVELGHEYRPSSKVSALLNNLKEERDQSSTDPLKSIVFSTWTSMLDLVQIALRKEGFNFVRVDGAKSETIRQTTIERFRSDKDCNILLASIGTAGVGYYLILDH